MKKSKTALLGLFTTTAVLLVCGSVWFGARVSATSRLPTGVSANIPTPTPPESLDLSVDPLPSSHSLASSRRDEPRRLQANDLTQRAQQLRQQYGPRGFHVVVCEPFVVLGDEDAQVVESRATQTVRWAVDHLRKKYFPDDPERIVDIWLFRDRDSYEKNCQEILGIKPHTPYGFYSSTKDVLVMNISTGGGTLVHEIVHPFMAANFPQCPSWFNEGLASLYEQCATKNDTIWGLTNWRLRGLQLSLEQQRVPSFKTLTATSTREFYDDDPGTNYAQARYLCYYLQEQGLLTRFYTEFRQQADEDPTGLQTLARILEVTDWPDFERRWQTYVLGLKFPE